MAATTGIVIEHNGRRVVICDAPAGRSVGDMVSVTINAQEPAQKTEDAVVALLEGRAMSMMEITRALQRFRAADLRSAIASLASRGVVNVTKHSTGGRFATVIQLTQHATALDPPTGLL
jgi:hypothetical protein